VSVIVMGLLRDQADGRVRVDEYAFALYARDEELLIRLTEQQLPAHPEFTGLTGRAVQVVGKFSRIDDRSHCCGRSKRHAYTL
jgi:hypothetical protein